MSAQPDRALMRAVAEVMVNEEKARVAADRELAAELREVVTEAVTPLTARLAEIEARPAEKGEKGDAGDAGEPGAVGAPGEKGERGEAGDLGTILLSPELAAEVAAAVRMLHESPPIVQRNAPPQSASPPPPPRPSRIERDEAGGYTLIYDEPPPWIIELSEAAGNAILDVLAAMMDGGSIELRSDAERVLAVLKLSDPATQPASGGELVFNTIAEEKSALAQGHAMTARILASDGSEVFSCDVGDENSDAVIKLNDTKINRRSPVQIHSFKLAMP